MQLSDSTLDILRNFSSINQNILIKADSPIKTISEARNVVAKAEIPEKFVKDFGIYDLNEFIGVTGLVNNPSLHFNDDFVMISDESGRSSVKYFYSAEETLELLIKANDGILSLSIVENQNSTSNAFSIDIDGEFKQDAVFNFIIDISNLKILPGDYDVEISSKLITQFSHKELSVKYWIALEKSSTYGV